MKNSGLTRRDFLKTTAAGGVSALAAGRLGAESPDTRPNVLFINTDQQRCDTLGCYGNSAAGTPHFDALAARGTVFTSCYATQPVCSPCRSSMVTGLFPNTTTVVENNIPLPPELPAWPRMLRGAGYRTAYIGKWHLGVDPVPDYFDVWKGFHTGWKHFVREEPYYAAPGEMDAEFQRKTAKTPPPLPEGKSLIGRYRPDVETDQAIAFIRESGGRPFACWLSFYPPHTPKEAPEENIAPYRGKIMPEEQAIYQAMVNRLDWNLGRLMDALEELGLREKTLVVFTSDHGENHPLRWNNHLKRLCYDQAANVPLLVSQPGTLPEGARVESVVSVADLCPTLLDLCGMAPPPGLHGQSMKTLLAGDAAGWRGDAFIQNTPHVWGARGGPDPDMRERCVVTGEWKLILNTSRTPELYDRRAPRPDTDNVFGKPEQRETVRALAARLEAWAALTGDEITAALLAQWAGEWA